MAPSSPSSLTNQMAQPTAGAPLDYSFKEMKNVNGEQGNMAWLKVGRAPGMLVGSGCIGWAPPSPTSHGRSLLHRPAVRGACEWDSQAPAHLTRGQCGRLPGKAATCVSASRPGCVCGVQ